MSFWKKLLVGFFLFFCVRNFVTAQCTVNVSPTSASICRLQTTATITASGASTYVWSPAAGLSGTTGATVTASPLVTTTYKVVGTCANNHKDSTTIVVTVKPLPTAAFTFTPTIPPCANTPIVFTGTATGTGLNYAWAFGDGNTSTLLSPTNTYSSAIGNSNQTFSATFTVTSSNGCSATVSHNVTVKQLPSAAMGGTGSSTINGQPYFKQCTSNSTATFTFTNTSTTTATNTNYVINWGDGSPNFTSTTSWGPTQTHSYAIGIYTLAYTVTGGNGCTNTINYNVFVGSNPAVGIGNPGNTTICGPNTLTFPITGTANNPPGTTYTVVFNDGSAPVNFTHPPPTTVSHTFNTSSCGTTSSNGTNSYPNSYSASITATNPCGTSAGSVVPIYVSAPPVGSFSYIPVICVNSSNTFTNTTVGYDIDPISGICNQNTQPAVWSISPATGWTSGSSFGNTFGLTDPNLWSAGSNSLSATFTTIGSYTITMITGSTNGCGLDTVVQILCVVPPPTPSFTMTPPNACSPSVINITNTSLGSAGCSSLGYSWSLSYTSGCVYYSSGSYIFSSGSNTSANPSLTFSTPGNYAITLSVTNVCGTYSTTNSTVVKDVPYITTYASYGSCTPATTSPASYFGISPCGGTISNYAWTYSGGTPATATGASPGNVTFNTSGSHSIQVTATNECGSSSASVGYSAYPIPVVNAGADQTICDNVGGTILNSSVSSGTPSYYYSWSPSASSYCCPSVNPSTTTTYYLSVSDYYGCSGSDSVIVNVKPAPVVTISAIPNAVCYGNSVALNSTSTIAGTTYSWSGSGLGSTTGANVSAIPTSSGNFSVTGTAPNTCSSTQSTYVTVYPLPNLSVSPSTNNFICLGNSVALTAFGANTYQWKPTTGLSSTTSSTVTASPTTTTTYTLIGTSINNCKDSIAVVVNVNGLPTVTASASLPVTCPRHPNTLTAGGASTYSWSPATGLNTTTGSVVIASPTVTTTYVVTGQNGANCQDTQYVVAVVKPIADLTIMHSDSTVCKKQTVDTIHVSGGTAGYVWSPATGLNTTSGAVVIASPTVTTKYFITAVNTQGCSITDSTMVTVNPLPATNAGIDQTICFGTSTIIGPTATAGYSYSWSPATGLNTTTSATPTASPTDTTTYILLQTDNVTGCYQRDTMLVTVVPLPVAPTLGSNNPVCWYSTISLTASGNAGATYTWTGPNGFSSSLQNPNHIHSLFPDTGYYYCQQFIGGCYSPFDSVFVHMFPRPAALSGINQTICKNQSANIGAAQVPGSTYTWHSTPSGYSSTSPNDVVTPTVTTTYIIAETDIHNCIDSNNVVITVKPLPVVSFTNPSPACLNIGSLFTNTSTGSIVTNDWNWGDGSAHTGIISPNHGYTAVGTYQVKLICTTTDGCIDSITHTITTVTVPKDSFTLNPHVGCGPLAVNFQNFGSGYNPSYLWDLGYNGNQYTGTVPPTTTYPEPFKGDTLYHVYLIASNVCGNVSYQDSILVHPSPHASFGTNLSVGCSPLPIHFSNVSVGNPTSYLWSFGDGSATDTSKTPPVHVYHTGTLDTTYIITLIVHNACGDDTTSHTILVHPNTVNAFFNVTPTNGCAPLKVVVHNFSTGGNNIGWNFSNGNYSNKNVDSTIYTQAGTYTIYLSVNNGCSFDTATAAITVYPVPNVIATPSPQGICSGNATNISLSSLVAGTTFGWTVTQNGVTGASNGSGLGISQALSLTGATPGSAIYLITPSPSTYGCVGSSIKDTVNVGLMPVATATPAAVTLCSGSAPTVNLSSSIAGTTFSWTVTQNNVTGASSAIGSTINQTLFTVNPHVGFANYTVTPNYAGCAGAAVPVNITVNNVPNVTATPSSASICTGTAPNITLTSTDTSASFSWTVVQSGVTGATSGSGTIISQTLTTTGNTSGTATYTITPTANGCIGTPINVVVIANPIPTVTSTPTAQTICSGNSTAISLSSNVAGTSFSWTQSSSQVAGASNASGANINQTLTATSTVAGSTTYTVTPAVGGCTGTSINVPITVSPIPLVTATPTAQTICSGDSSNISLSSNVVGTTFSWTVAQNGVSGAVAGNGSLIHHHISTTGNSTGTCIYTITPTANGCLGNAITVTITVNPIPVVTATPANQTICSGTATSINLTSSVTGSTFSWIVANSNVSGASGGSGSVIAQTLNSLGTTIASATYTITTTANGCAGNPLNVVATVNPIPVVITTPSAQTICSGTKPTINLTSPVSGTTYAWTVSQSNVVGASNSIGNTIHQILNTTTNFIGTVNYTITPTANGCSGTPVTVTITVQPNPSLSIIYSKDSVCANKPILYSFVNNSLSSFNWKLGDGVTSLLNPVVHQYTASGLYTVTLIGTSSTYGCTDSAKKIIHILPTPVLHVTASPVFGCQPLTVQISNNTIAATFHNWTFGDGNTSNTSQSNFSHVYTNAGVNFSVANYPLQYIASNNFGCADTANFTITVYPKPTAAFGMKGSAPCVEPYNDTLTNFSIAANGYTWHDGQGNVLTSTNPVISYTAGGTYNLQLIAGNTYGCYDTTSKQVTDYPPLHSGFTATPATGCQTLFVTFSDTTTASYYQYWTFGDGGNATNNFTPHYTYQNAGLYDVTLRVEGLNHVCIDSIHRVGYINVLQTPVASFIYDDANSPPPAVNVNFTSNSQFASQFIWNFGDGSASVTTNDVNTTHIYGTTGDYQVELIAVNADGCMDTTLKKIHTEYTTGLYVPNAMSPNAGNNDDVKVFKPKGYGLATYHVWVYSTWGEKLWESTALDEHGSPTEFWDGTFKGELMPQDAYVWKIEAQFTNESVWKGMSYDGKNFSKTGTITLLR